MKLLFDESFSSGAHRWRPCATSGSRRPSPRSVRPFSPIIHVADGNVGLLVISAMPAVGVLGIVLGGSSSNSHYALLGSLRSVAQLISYEVALAFALLSGVMVAAR